MTLAISVRPARLDDLPVIVELRLALLREYRDHPLYGSLHPDATERAFELYRAQITSPFETILLAERLTERVAERITERRAPRRGIVGILRCVDTPSSPLMLPERYCYVSSAYVRPDERRQGVLSALLTAAEQWCEGRGLSEMRLHNSSSSEVASAAWQALGFEPVEQVRRLVLTAPRLTGAPRIRARSF